MCGITGFIDFKNNCSEQIVRQMTGSMLHRGPDGQGHYFVQTNEYQLGFGHSRLSIIDLSHEADQPMHFDGLSIVFNGEIYNYNEIREDLLRLGHKFKTHSDTEVILHSWKQWGEDAIKKWRGMFAICLFDNENNELVCIRDRAGVKPFYYYYDNELFLFGSELKSLMAHKAFSKEINVNAVASFLQFGYISQPYCIFTNTFKLAAGHILRFKLGIKKMELHQYWNVYEYYNKPKLSISLPEAIIETEKILEESFKYRMVADVPVGVFLSGGYDSACVTAILQKNSSEKLKTFTIGTTDKQLDEAPFAREIARHLGTDHTEYYCTSKEALDIIPDLPFYYDEPFADSSSIPTILVSRMAREKVTVALSADAGDEIFAGYGRYDFIRSYVNKISAIPKPLRKLLVSIFELLSPEIFQGLINKGNFPSRYKKLKNLLNNPTAAELARNLDLVYDDIEIADLMKNKPDSLLSAHTSRELMMEYYDPLSFMMAIDYQTYMVDDILQKVDRATMSISLEGREPFLDQHIIEWAAQLPSEYKYYKGTKKYILRKIVHQYIPQSMMDRPKMGFGIPVRDWLGNELKPLVKEYISGPALDHGIFNEIEVERLMRDFFSGKNVGYLKVWYLLMFQMWYKRWM